MIVIFFQKVSIWVSEITRQMIFDQNKQKVISPFNLVFMNIKEHFPGSQTIWNVILALLSVKYFVEIITVFWDFVSAYVK